VNYGKTRIIVCEDEADLGRRAATAVAAAMRKRLAQHDEIRMIFAAGQSQMAFLDDLAQEPGLDWQRVVCLNMDDFWDPRLQVECSCGYQTRTQLYDKVKPKRFELVRYNAPDPEAEARRYAGVLEAAQPVDILCQGIGMSGHLALDEPYQADFDTELLVKVVDVDEQSKRQLLADPNFRAAGYIPAKGITMTIPAMLMAAEIFTMVPLRLKREIVTRVLLIRTPTTAVPATILSRHEGTLFLDRDSCPPAWGGRP